jgi:hypothetical protein
VAAADKTDQFHFKRPPRADSFMRWLGCAQMISDCIRQGLDILELIRPSRSVGNQI